MGVWVKAALRHGPHDHGRRPAEHGHRVRASRRRRDTPRPHRSACPPRPPGQRRGGMLTAPPAGITQAEEVFGPSPDATVPDYVTASIGDLRAAEGSLA
jgi:hypothetical protein